VSHLNWGGLLTSFTVRETQASLLSDRSTDYFCVLLFLEFLVYFGPTLSNCRLESVPGSFVNIFAWRIHL